MSLSEVKIKETTFQNLVGNFKFNKTFNLDSWPRYFLVDENGIFQKNILSFQIKLKRIFKKFYPEKRYT